MEIKSKKIGVTAEISEYDEQKAITVLLNSDQSKELILLLSLLREKLTDVLEIEFKNITFYLKLGEPSQYSKSSMFDITQKVFKASLSLDSLEAILYYLLRYYGKDIGEAEHIDIDFDFKDIIITWTIKLDKYLEISGEELNKRLGLQ